MNDTATQHAPSANGNGRHKHNGQAPDVLSSYVFGKQQPQAVPLEEAVLGALMLDREIYGIVSDIVRPETFYIEKHREIYRSIQSIANRNDPVDLLTVTEEMRQTGTIGTVDGGYYLVELTHRVASAANTEYHARILEQKYIARCVIEICTRAVKEAYEETTDVFDMLDALEGAISKVRIWQGRQEIGFDRLGAIVIRDLEERSQSVNGLSGVPTGLTEYDRLTGGLQKTDLICMAGRPGMGKTALMLSAALNAARDFGKSVLIFSLEMSALQLAKRVAAMDGEIDGEKMRGGKLTETEWKSVLSTAEKMAKWRVWVDDTPGIDLYELKNKARKLTKKHKINVIFVDYLQLITLSGDAAKGKNRDQTIGEISRALKGLAKELDIPIVMLSQLSRAVETRGGAKRPMLSDLRESGNVEQDCDLITFVYRPEYYGITQTETGRDLRGIAELINAKNRHGAIDSCEVAWVEQFTLFRDIDTFAPMPQPNDFTIPKSATEKARANEEDIPF